MNNNLNTSGKLQQLKAAPSDVVAKMMDVMIKAMTEAQDDKDAPMMMGSDFVPRVFGGLAFAMLHGTMMSMAEYVQDHKQVVGVGQRFAMDMNQAATVGLVMGFEQFAKEYKKT